PFGLALRASGYGLRSLITRFIHHDLESGEAGAMANLAPNLVIDASALKGPVLDDALAKVSFKNAAGAAVSGTYDIVVLDGVLKLVASGMIPMKKILDLMREKASHVELLLTGPECDNEIMVRADLVTEMAVLEQTSNEQPNTIQVVTGKGKGKTTYCLGNALLMSSMGADCFILQTIKSPRLYGEVMAIENLPGMEIQSMGKGLVDKKCPNGDPDHKKAARKAWARAKEIVLASRYDLVVLDEINIAVNYGYIHHQEVLDLLMEKPESVQIILGGRYAHPELIKVSDVTMEMKEIKHPYKRGVRARWGIEY
ncbi:MAG: cob(I)yrinic acid a,c-diamide adenosyltransferase, partial [Deltaproteobacteria bacterium]|nr:cob(I)yrinic acid a,c-diamide adenosyltransferase [Deltaproteobacteria bacterium]